ncbi:MAG: transcriptional regulator, LytR family [Herbinix sp.]|jgi:ABC-2 type transport system ATP-binding protein|nr:transcriptional regulator, LytR family [Herbinix sp.]
MLLIKDLYKEKNNNILKDITLHIGEGNSVSFECSDEISNLLVDLILGQEIPAKGEILFKDTKLTNLKKGYLRKIGVIRKEETFYEHMTINEYMRFFSEIIDTKTDYKEIMLKLALLDIGNTRLKKLNYSQKKRLSFARERLKEPELLLFQDPILNLDRDSAKIITQNIEELCVTGTAVLVTSVFFRNTVMVGEKAYRIDIDGLSEINHNEEVITNKPLTPSVSTVYKVDKIPAKVEDKLLLFDPMDIDYVESEQGINFLSIRGEKFPCAMSLTDLEERLKNFGFFRCHRSYLINLQRVNEVITWTRNSYSLCLGDKQKSSIPLSKGRLEELKEILKI